MDDVRFTVNNLTSGNGKFRISNISFNLVSGDMLGLVGRSGSGKSTIIKTLLGLNKTYAGRVSITIDDIDYDLEEIVGYSSQENCLYPFLTLKENLNVFGKIYGLDRDYIEHNTKFLLKRLHLTKFLNTKIKDFSGGMQKRADLAVALIHAPKIIILDEPFNGLDIYLQRFIWRLLEDLSKQGKIVIVSSHIIEDIQRHCNKIGLVHNNKYYDTNSVNKILNRNGNADLKNYLHSLFSEVD